MGTTRSLKQLRLSGPQKVRDTGDPGQKKTTGLQFIYTRTLDFNKGLAGTQLFLKASTF